MVTGVPCMCMSTTGTPCSAQRGSSAGSKRPAETSFTTSAPSSSARRTIVALEVSTEIGTRTAARTPRGGMHRSPGDGRGFGHGLSGGGGRRAPEATVLSPELAEDRVDLGAVDRLALEERLGHLVEHLEVAAQEELGALVGLEQDAAHLGVDLDGGLLGVVDLLREVAA